MTAPSPLRAHPRSTANPATVGVLRLARGADPTPKTLDGKTALAIAEAQGHATVARRLRGALP